MNKSNSKALPCGEGLGGAKYDWFPYHVCRRRGVWAVYRYHSEKRLSAEKISSFARYEDARNEAYRLNRMQEEKQRIYEAGTET